MNRDCFEKRLEYAHTLPSNFYTNPAFLEQEQEKIFSCTWQLVGKVDQVSSPGDYFTTTVANEPVVVVCGKDFKIRSFSNVCRHRAGPVASGQGNSRFFQCLYHAWTYGIDGKLLGTPEFSGVECFSREENGLPEFETAIWGNLIFVNLSKDSPTLADFLGDIPTRIACHDIQSMSFAARKDWYVDCNWKVYVDNYLEGYHIPTVHPNLNKELDYSEYITDTGRYYSVQYSPVRNREGSRIGGKGNNRQAQYFWLFPNLMINVYPDNFSTNLIIPISPTRTLTIFEWYFLNPDQEEVQRAIKQTIEFSDEIQIEDIAICEAVQKGLKSKTYDRGRYSVKRENGVHHFHTLLANYFG